MSDPTYILGISCFYHDAAACLLRDGEILAAASEERFSRIKHDSALPKRAIQYCLDEAGITDAQLDLVGFYDKPFLKFERILETYISYVPRGLPSFLKAVPLWMKKKLWTPDLIHKALPGFEGELILPEHHPALVVEERVELLVGWANALLGLPEARERSDVHAFFTGGAVSAR